jgi:glutamine synthetase
MEIKDLCGTGTSGASRYPAFPAAPVLLAYSVRNRSASCRIRYTIRRSSASKCVSRTRGQSGLASAAMVMAGLDGIKLAQGGFTLTRRSIRDGGLKESARRPSQ